MIMSTGSGSHWEHILYKICANEKNGRSHPFITHSDNVISKWDWNNIKCVAYHFLLVNVRGGFPLVKAFLGVVVVLPLGTVRESMVTLARRIILSKVNCSALRSGGTPPASAGCWGSGFRLNTVKIWWTFRTVAKIFSCIFILFESSTLSYTNISIILLAESELNTFGWGYVLLDQDQMINNYLFFLIVAFEGEWIIRMDGTPSQPPPDRLRGACCCLLSHHLGLRST